MSDLIPGLLLSIIKPPQIPVHAAKRRVLTEKWYGRKDVPETFPNSDQTFFNINDEVYIVDAKTGEVQVIYVARISGKDIFFYDRKGDAPFSMTLYDALTKINKPQLVAFGYYPVRHVYVCNSEIAAIKLLYNHAIPSILSLTRSKKNLNCKKQRWKNKQAKLKNLKQIHKRIYKYLQENP